MPKFLITKKSHNRITGPIMVTTSPRITCPTACPLRKTAGNASAGGCYAEHGFLGGFIWSQLDKLEKGQKFKAGQIRVYDLPELLEIIRELPEKQLLRHNQAGDLFSNDQATIDEDVLAKIVKANKGRRGFTYTHYDVLNHAENRNVISTTNKSGFTINLSANTIEEADELVGMHVAPVTVLLPPDSQNNITTPKGNKIVVCPALKTQNITCATCGICSKQRRAIVGFPAIGAGKTKTALATKAA